MKRWLIILTFFAVNLPLSALEMTKEQHLKLITQVNQKICKDKDLLSCINIDETKCWEAYSSSMKSCQNILPDTIRNPAHINEFTICYKQKIPAAMGATVELVAKCHTGLTQRR